MKRNKEKLILLIVLYMQSKKDYSLSPKINKIN